MSQDVRAVLQRGDVRKVLNQSRWDEVRYLIILHACTRLQPYALQAKTVEGKQMFRRSVLRDLAKEFGLDFEFFRGAITMLEDRLEKGFGYVKTLKGDGNYSYYSVTPQGAQVAESALNEAVNLAERMETVVMPSRVLDKFKEDLQKRAQEKGLDSGFIKELLTEYSGMDALALNPGANTAPEPRRVKLSHHKITIGRTPDNAVSFPSDRYISRTHAVVDWVDGGYWIRDLHSKNGVTRISENGHEVKVEREKVIPNAIYKLGTSTVIFEL